MNLYEKNVEEKDIFFRKHRFIKMSNGLYSGFNAFPILEGNCMKNMLLAIYILKHLRGNTIHEAVYDNDAFSFNELTRALIKKGVEVEGVFLGLM